MDKMNPNLPIYIQIMTMTKMKIANGTLEPGEKLKSVRDLALQFNINPNTVQRAMAELERQGYLVSKRTLGRFVTEDNQKIMQLKEDLSMEIIQKLVGNLRQLNLNKDKIIHLIERTYDMQEEKNGNIGN